jgi:protein SCO1/2
MAFLCAGAVVAADHSRHHIESARSDASGSQRSLVNYVIPPVKLVRADGKHVQFPDDMDDGRAVVLNFIFTSCTAICPVMTQSFAEFQAKLGADREKVRIISISIDPEQDTPARLREYGRKFNAGPHWVFYTGSVNASVTVQKAFAVYAIDKMSHTPLTLMRAAPGKPWLRLDGLASPDQLLQEYHRLTGS